MDRHELAEERSIALHRAVAACLRQDASVVVRARERLTTRQRNGTTHAFYVAAWLELLDGPLEALCAALVSGDERMRSLRQSTPFTFVVPPRERARIWKETKAQLGDRPSR
jgi:hypothetical protein